MATGGRESGPTGPQEGQSAAALGRTFVEISNSQVQGWKIFPNSFGSLIVVYVLGLDKEIAKATDNNIDDIIVNTEAVGVEKFVAHLANFGLITKAPEKIDDAKVLKGIQSQKREVGMEEKQHSWRTDQRSYQAWVVFHYRQTCRTLSLGKLAQDCA